MWKAHYNIHRKLRKSGLRVVPKIRTVYVGASKLYRLKKTDRARLNTLRQLGYTVQIEIE